jgi:integrase
MKNLPGFSFDPKAHTARFEVIIPETNSKKRRRKTVAVLDLSDFTKKFHEFRVAVLDGAEEAPLTFAGYVEKYGPEIQKRVKPRTAEREKQHLATLLPIFGALLLRRITASDVKGFVAQMKADGYHATTINNAFATLRKYLYDATERRVLSAYPFGRKAKEWRQKEPKLHLELSPEERAAFLSAFYDEAGFRSEIGRRRGAARVGRIDGRRERGLLTTSLHGGGTRPGSEAVGEHFERFRASRELFIVALETGLSRGDLFMLPWSAVDLKEGLVRIPREKTGEESLVAISDPLRAALVDLQKRAMARKEDRDLVLGGFSEMVALRNFALVKKLAGITRRFRFHDLRHSFACRHAAAGTPLQIIQKMMGHASIKTTERYSRVDENAVKTAVRALDRNQSLAANSSANSGGPSGASAASGVSSASDSKKAG